jgi:hypothetical protein
MWEEIHIQRQISQQDAKAIDYKLQLAPAVAIRHSET